MLKFKSTNPISKYETFMLLGRCFRLCDVFCENLIFVIMFSNNNGRI